MVEAHAFGASVLWAVSAQFIAVALRGARRDPAPILVTVIGLFVAIIVGSAATVLLFGFPPVRLLLNGTVVLTGIFTFLVGTGAYYFASVAYRDEASIASQYANVKPLISITAGVAIFGETLDGEKILAVMLVLAGILLIVVGIVRRHTSGRAFALGLLLATSWALGEIFARSSFSQFTPRDVTSGALVFCGLVSAVALGALALRAPSGVAVALLRPHMASFAIHGALSFFGAYYLFFSSIDAVGISDTILYTIFWPAMAFGMSVILGLKRLQANEAELYGAMVLFMASTAYFTLSG